MSGMHRSPYQGLAVEFAEHRQYVPGDDLKHLDWKVFGRTDKLHVKQYQQETNLDIVLLVDSSASMRFGTLQVKQGWGGTKASREARTWSKYDHATAIAAALCYLGLQQRDRVGLNLFAEGLRAQVRRSNARDTWRRAVRTRRAARCRRRRGAAGARAPCPRPPCAASCAGRKGQQRPAPTRRWRRRAQCARRRRSRRRRRART